MDDRIVLIVLGIIVGIGIGFTTTYYYFKPEVDQLTNEVLTQKNEYNDLTIQRNILEDEHEDLLEQHSTLTDEYGELTNQYISISQDYSAVTAQFNTLTSEHQNLQQKHDNLSIEYDIVSDKYDVMTGDILKISNDFSLISELLTQHCSLPDSFTRVLNFEEVGKMSSLVYSITNPNDHWYSRERIHKHVDSTIIYAQDIEFPYIHDQIFVDVDDISYLQSFEVSSIRDYVQTPIFTLDYKQGDCEDQAILVYAMIEYYEREIHGTDYATYIAKMEFVDGSGHVALIIPALEGNICILDPAGNYFTSRYNTITTKNAFSELDQYSNRWSSQGGIVSITLYEIDTEDGSYEIINSGTLNEIVTFFESH